MSLVYSRNKTASHAIALAPRLSEAEGAHTSQRPAPGQVDKQARRREARVRAQGQGAGRWGGSVGEGECWFWSNHDCHTGDASPRHPPGASSPFLNPRDSRSGAQWLDEGALSPGPAPPAQNQHPSLPLHSSSCASQGKGGTVRPTNPQLLGASFCKASLRSWYWGLEFD